MVKIVIKYLTTQKNHDYLSKKIIMMINLDQIDSSKTNKKSQES